MKSVSKQLLLIALGVLILTDLPLIYAKFSTPPGRLFSGFYFFHADKESYLSKIKQGQMGRWKWDNLYTPEITRPQPLFLFYILSGQISRPFGVSPYLTYQITRHLMIFLALFEVFAFTGLFLTRAKSCQALALYTFTSGAGFLSLVFGTPVGKSLPLDLWVPEAIGFMTFAGPPHIILSLGIMLRLMRHGHHFAHTRTPVPRAEINILSLILALTAPYCLIAAILFNALALFERTPVSAIIQRLPEYVKSLPWAGLAGGLWLYLVIHTDPELQTWNAQNQTKLFGVIPLVLAYLPLLVLTGCSFLKPGKPSGLLLVWILINLLLLYSPVSFSRRFLLGFSVPLSILAVQGLDSISSRLKIPLTPFRFTALVILLAGSNLFYLSNAIYHIRRARPPFAYSSAAINALKELRTRLKEMPSNPVVVSTSELSLLVPSKLGVKTYAGHFPETIDLERRAGVLKSFWKSPFKHLPPLREEIQRGFILFGPENKLNAFGNQYKVIYKDARYLALWIP